MKTHKQRVFTNPLTLAEKKPPRIGGGEAGGFIVDYADDGLSPDRIYADTA